MHQCTYLIIGGGMATNSAIDDIRKVECRPLDHYRNFRKLRYKYEEFTVIGGGFIEAKVAEALAFANKRVTILCPDTGICGTLFPKSLAGHLGRVYCANGIRVYRNTGVVSISGEGGSFRLHTDNGREIHADVVIAGADIQSIGALDKADELGTKDRSRITRTLHTSAPDIYAAEDIANFMGSLLQKRRRVEETAGVEIPHDHSPLAYSTLFGMGYQVVGKLDSSLTTIVDWKTQFKTGVVYYLDDDRVCGVLLWNVWGKVAEARELIEKGEQLHPKSLKGRIGDWGTQKTCSDEDLLNQRST